MDIKEFKELIRDADNIWKFSNKGEEVKTRVS